MLDLTNERLRMVRDQIAARGVHNPAVLEAMRRVPREAFLPEELAEFAYQDTPLPIEADQTISQPYIVALMIESVEPRASDRALEIGTGSGYAAAVLSEVVSEVYTIERHEQLAKLATERLHSLGILERQGSSWRRHSGLAGACSLRRDHRDRRRSAGAQAVAATTGDWRPAHHTGRRDLATATFGSSYPDQPGPVR